MNGEKTRERKYKLKELYEKYKESTLEGRLVYERKTISGGRSHKF